MISGSMAAAMLPFVTEDFACCRLTFSCLSCILSRCETLASQGFALLRRCLFLFFSGNRGEQIAAGDQGGNTMSNCAIVGINWGDEGKGRMVDLLTQDHDIVVRYQGGGNADIP